MTEIFDLQFTLGNIVSIITILGAIVTALLFLRKWINSAHKCVQRIEKRLIVFETALKVHLNLKFDSDSLLNDKSD